jgi:hypothetical protein
VEAALANHSPTRLQAHPVEQLIEDLPRGPALVVCLLLRDRELLVVDTFSALQLPEVALSRGREPVAVGCALDLVFKQVVQVVEILRLALHAAGPGLDPRHNPHLENHAGDQGGYGTGQHE